MSRPVSKILLAVALLVVVLGLALGVMSLSRPPAPPLPNPNGYADFVKAGQLVQGDLSSSADMQPEELRQALTNNAEVLKLARVGLSRQSRVPMQYVQPNEPHFDDLKVLKPLVHAFVVEGRLAELEHRPADAARSYLDAIRVGHEAMRGGVIISALVSVAMETVGVGRLEKLVPALDATACRETAAALEAIDAKREPFDTTLAQERAWVRRTYGIKGQLMMLVTFKSVLATQQRTMSRAQSNQVRTRQLMVNLAARACELEKGVRPTQISELVPTYLKAIPLDPTTGTNLNYRF